MKTNLSALALGLALAGGGLLGYQANERLAAQSAAPVQTAVVQGGAQVPQGSVTGQSTTGQSTTGQSTTAGQTVQALQTRSPLTGYNSARARTESEANTVQVVKERQNGLVYISVTEGGDGGQAAQLRRQLQEQFGGPLGDQAPTGTGSGFFVNKQGDIITNNHVVEGASRITIRLHGNKQTYQAKVIARAPDYDLALIRAEGVPAASIQPLPLGQSDGLEVGLKAIAMGAPFDLDFSVSEGIISSVERQAPVGQRGVMQSVIQTDAAINPGNSGGPLLDSAGQVIGVNTQILTGGVGQSAGVGFAIPVNTVKKLLPQLQAGGTGAVVSPPTLGILFADLSALTPQERADLDNVPASGALVRRVYPGSPAAAAGLRGSETGKGADVITAIGGQPVRSGQDLRDLVFNSKVGDKVRLSVQRGGQTREVTVTLRAFDLSAQMSQE